MKIDLQLNHKYYFLTAFLLFILSLNNVIQAQVATSYNFSDADGSITFIGNGVGTTLTTGATNDAVYPGVPIGFEFKFNGKLYDTLGVSNNGFIWFGNTNPAASVNSPISDNTAEDGVISAYGSDIQGKSGSARLQYQTTGVAPNRVFTVQWFTYNFVGHTSSRTDLQISLSECSGVIKIYLTGYQYLWGGGFSVFGQVGLRGSDNTDFFNESVDCSTNDWDSPSQGGSNAANCKMNGSSGIGLGGCWPAESGGSANIFTYTPKVAPPIPSLVCTNPGAACTGVNTGVPVTFSSGTAPYNISWTFTNGTPAPPGGNASNVSSPYNGISTTYGSAATSSYSVTLTDANGCAATCSGNITVTTCGANSITTGTVTGSPFCACASVSVPFTSTGTFNAGNNYTAQLSDPSGSFTAPVTIGTMQSVANSGTISATIPCNATSGTKYRIRVVSDNPVTTGTDNGSDITINATVVPAVSVSASPAGAICTGTSVTFTATPTNGGVPTYQWEVNGNVQPGTGNTFSSNTLNNNDVVTVIMTSTANCASPSTAPSAPITMIVTNSLTASVTIAASPSDTICTGNQVTFTASPTNGGTPTYQWNLNSNPIGGATNSTYSSSGLNNADNITVTMTSNAGCVTVPVVNSNAVVMTVNSSIAAAVNIVGLPSDTVCTGTQVTFSATPTGGGNNPSYQWEVNGLNAGTDSANFTTSNLFNGDIIFCVMTSSSSCATGSPATSQPIVMRVITGPVASVNVTPSQTIICQGTPINFTANSSNGGLKPHYQWQVDGIDVGTDSVHYSNNNLQNGDSVTVIMTSNAQCVQNSPATASEIHITVNGTVTPGIVSTTKNTICAGSLGHLNLTGNSSDTIHWQSSSDSLTGFTDIPGATSSSYVTPPVSTTKYYRANVGTGNCQSATNSVLITVLPAPIAVFTSSFTGAQEVTFNADSSKGATSYFWDFGDGATSSTKNPVHDFKTDSTYHVCLTVKNNSNCNFTLCENVIVTGVNNINDAAVWQVYPDPFSSQLYISIGQATTIVESIEMYDVLGRQVFLKKVNGIMENPMRVDVSYLKAGVYYLTIRTKDNAFVKPVVKQ